MPGDIYETKDLYFAAFLDLKMENSMQDTRKATDPKTGKQVTYFVFKRTTDVSVLKSQYFSGRGEVSALRYADKVRNLKALLYV